MTFSGYEPHECPDWARCPVCKSTPLELLGKSHDDHFTLLIMVEDGLIDASLVDGGLTEVSGDPLLKRRKAA